MENTKIAIIAAIIAAMIYLIIYACRSSEDDKSRECNQCKPSSGTKTKFAHVSNEDLIRRLMDKKKALCERALYLEDKANEKTEVLDAADDEHFEVVETYKYDEDYRLKLLQQAATLQVQATQILMKIQKMRSGK